MNQPIETYTFSRALHLMRNGGRKMKCLSSKDSLVEYCFVDNNIFKGFYPKIGGTQFLLDSYEILGEWVEVK